MKMKKTLSLVLTLAVFLCCVPFIGVPRAQALYSGNLEYEIEDLQVTITGCKTTASGALEIPEKIGLLYVTGIGYDAFYECDKLTSITIPKSVNYIEEYAFYGCTSLTEVKVNSANECYSDIDGVLFDKDAVYLIYYPEGRAGAYDIPESVEYIDFCAFNLCIYLTEIFIPSKVEYLDTLSFVLCSSLEAINISGNNEFYKSIDGLVFSKDASELLGCPVGKSGAYPVPESVTAIAWYAFYNCVLITEITMTDNVKSIGESAFFGCPSLLCVTVPYSVENIGYEAFGFYCNDEYDIVKVENFLIRCVYESAAHDYAIENGFACEFFEPDRLIVKSDSNLYLDRDSGTITGYKGKQTSEAFLSRFVNKNVEVCKDGEKLPDGAFVSTGCVLEFFNESETIESYTIIISGDVDRDGEISVRDARKILRVAVGLDNLGDDIWAACAADVTGFTGEIKIDDARCVLRVAVGLGASHSKEDVLNFYKDAVNAITSYSAAGYTNRAWEEFLECEIEGFGNDIIGEMMDVFLNTEYNPIISVYEKGSEDAKMAFPACTLTDTNAIQSVDCKLFGDKCQIKIVMKDEINPKKGESEIAKITDNVVYFEDLKDEIEGSGYVQSFDEERNKINLDDFTVICTLTKDGRFISLTHSTLVDLELDTDFDIIPELQMNIKGNMKILGVSEYESFIY